MSLETKIEELMQEVCQEARQSRQEVEQKLKSAILVVNAAQEKTLLDMAKKIGNNTYQFRKKRPQAPVQVQLRCRGGHQFCLHRAIKGEACSPGGERSSEKSGGKPKRGYETVSHEVEAHQNR